MTYDKFIYQEVDGLHCFSDSPEVGCYAAHDLRAIADRLDALNAPIYAELASGLASTAGDIGTGEG
jgi:hypothetical protein